LLTRMTGNCLHMQWPLTSQLHGSVSQREQLVFRYGSNRTPSSYLRSVYTNCGFVSCRRIDPTKKMGWILLFRHRSHLRRVPTFGQKNSKDVWSHCRQPIWRGRVGGLKLSAFVPRILLSHRKSAKGKAPMFHQLTNFIEI
jgi:hypothetical protein